jgi:hypothetical protein
VRRSVVLGLVLVVLAGCGDDDDDAGTDASAIAAAATGVDAADGDDPGVVACDLLTPSEVGAVLGSEPTATPTSSAGSSCRYEGDGGHVDVVVLESDGATTADLDALAAEETDAETVDGIGDAAFVAVASGKVGLVAEGVLVVIAVAPTAGPATRDQLVQLGGAAGGRAKPGGVGPSATTAPTAGDTVAPPTTATTTTTVPEPTTASTSGEAGDLCALVATVFQDTDHNLLTAGPEAIEAFFTASVDLFDRAQELAPPIAADLALLEEAYRAINEALARYGYDFVEFAAALSGDADAQAATALFESPEYTAAAERAAQYVEDECGIVFDTNLLTSGG